MNKEINIKIPGQILDFVDTKEHLLDLFYYITNLQQDIDKLTAESTEWESKYYEMQDNFHNTNDEIERLKFKIDSWQSYSHELEDYKSRCEKAIEYIKDNMNTYTNGKDYKLDEFNILASPKYLLNILQGSEDNELVEFRK